MKNVTDYYNKTATGWSDEWLKEKKQSNNYWNNNGKHQDLVNQLNGKSIDKLIEEAIREVDFVLLQLEHHI